jgi:hypothetical protein
MRSRTGIRRRRPRWSSRSRQIAERRRAFVAQLTDNPSVPRLPRRSPAVLLALALVCALLLDAGGAVAAAGSGNPLSGGVTAPATPTPTTATQAATSATTTTAAGGGGSIGKSSVIAIVIGAVVVIGGVCIYIFRDASRRAPSRGRRAAAEPNADRRVPGSQRVKPRKLSTQERRRRKRGRAPRRK